MVMPHRRRRQRPGFPEAGFLIALAVAVAPLTYWWTGLNRPNWLKTSGSVIAGAVEPTHYNAEDYEPKVHLRYQYYVGEVTYSDEYEGLWPNAVNRNALPPSHLNELTKPGHPLVVSYDPNHPSRNTLLPEQQESQVGYFLFSLGGLVVGGAYCLLVYPALRRR